VTIVYFDSSAFAKLVVEEEGSEVAATLWDGCDAAAGSRRSPVAVRLAHGSCEGGAGWRGGCRQHPPTRVKRRNALGCGEDPVNASGSGWT
jgi:hypothetical protein